MTSEHPEPTAIQVPVEVPAEVVTEAPADATTKVSTEVPAGVPTEASTEVPTQVAAKASTEVPAQTTQPPTISIEEGFVNKRGPLPLRLWQKRYFRLPAENHAYPLHKLRVVYRKTVKKINAPKEEFEKTNKYLLDTLATATVNSTSILAYFKSEDKDELPQGFINLKQVDDIIPSPKIKPFAFTIKTKSRDFVFSTNSQTDTDSWVSTLKALSKSEIPDFSDTAAYQFSYSQLADRKDFASPSAPAQDDEVFSASEAELDSDEVAPKEVTEISNPKDLTIEVPPTDGSVADSKPSTVKDESNGNMSPRKSFYTEVLDFFYRKGPEQDQVKENPESASAPELIEATEPVADKAVAVEEVEVPAEVSREIAEIVAPIAGESSEPAVEAAVVEVAAVEAPVSTPVETPVEAAAANGPKRSKTFVLPKFEGKIFKIFKKNGEQVVVKDAEAVPEPSANDETASEPAPKESIDVPAADIAVVEETMVTPEVKESEEASKAVEEVATETPVETEVKEVTPVAAEEPLELVPDVVPAAVEETVVEPEAVAAVEESVAEVKAVEASEPAVAFDSVPEPVIDAEAKEAKEEKRPFIKRILSGKRKSKVVEAPVVVAPAIVAAEEVAPKEVEAGEVAPVEAAPEVTSTESVPEAVSAEAATEATPEVKEATPEVSFEAPVAQEEASTEAASPKQPFIKRLLSGNIKGKSEATSPVTEAAPEVVAEPTEEAVVVAEPETVAEPVAEASATEEVPAEAETTEAKEVSKEVASSEPQAEEAEDKKDDLPTPQRQTSLFGRIGELAYSAVAPTAGAVPEETEEDISEHYVDKIKEALHSGFLYKQSNLLHTNNLRFFLLGKDGVVTYYRSVKVASEGKKVVINDETEVSPVDDLLITIKAPAGTIYNFQAKTKEDRDAWYEAIKPFAKAPAPVVEADATEVVEAPAATTPEVTSESAPVVADATTPEVTPAAVAEVKESTA